ncbi:MAG: succinate dehydrogenase, hydrophobic membrane anchor protein [Rickettsiales bacterium]
MKNNFTSDIAKAKNLGSSHSGSSHWYWQRISALFLVPLYVWFVLNMINFFINPESVVASTLYNPFYFLAFLLLVNVTLFHAVLGIRVVIEDYVHGEVLKNTLLIASYFATFVTMVTVSFILIVNFIVNI